MPAWKCRAREGVCCPALVGTLLREEQWNRNLVPCAEQVLCCSCADHDRLRSIRGIPAPVFSCMRDRVAEFRVCVAAWQAGAAPSWCRSKAIRCAQGRFRGPVPNRGFLGQSGAYRCFPGPGTPAVPYRAVQRSCAAALGVPRCIGFYLRKRSCRHTAAYGSLSLSVCVATLLRSGSTHRHSQGLQCFLSRSPTLSGSFQKNLRLS